MFLQNTSSAVFSPSVYMIAMKYFRLSLLVSCILWLTTFAQPIVEIPRLQVYGEFYDVFGEETSLVYFGGYVAINCVKDFAGDCDSNKRLNLLSPDDVVIGSATCRSPNLLLASWILDIDETLKLGRYKCQYDGQDLKDTLDINYRLCGDHEHACLRTNCEEPDKLCIITTNQSMPCAKIPNVDWCDSQVYCYEHVKKNCIRRVCPADTGSLCAAIAADYSKAWAIDGYPFPKKTADLARYCPNIPSSVPRLYYARKHFVFNEPIFLNASLEKKVTVNYTNNTGLDNAYLNCSVVRLKRWQGNYALVDSYNSTILHAASFVFNDQIFSANTGSALLRLECTFYKMAHGASDQITDRYRLRNYLIRIGGDITVTTPLNTDNRLQCDIKPTPPVQFQTQFWWTAESQTGFRQDGREIEIPATDKYKCHVRVIYKTCSPYRMFEDTLQSAWFSATAKAEKKNDTGLPPSTTASIRNRSVSCIRNSKFDTGISVVAFCICALTK